MHIGKAWSSVIHGHAQRTPVGVNTAGPSGHTDPPRSLISLSLWPQTPFSLIHVLDVVVILSFLLAFCITHRYQRRRGLRYPPGPPGWPVIGNLLDIPLSSPWLAYTESSKKYGMSDLSTSVQAYSLRLGHRAHCLLPCSWTGHYRIEHYQSRQRSTRKTWKYLLRSSSCSPR
jgi:hypothetical protein